MSPTCIDYHITDSASFPFLETLSSPFQSIVGRADTDYSLLSYFSCHFLSISHTRSCSSTVSRLHVQVWYGPGASASDGCSTDVRCGVPGTESLHGSERIIKNEEKGLLLTFFRSPSSKFCGNCKACCVTFHLAQKTVATKSRRECQVDWS